MVIRYRPFQGARVSARWRVVLLVARKDRVRFTIHSGHRTLPEQLKLFRQNMVRVGTRFVPRPGHPLTAFPTPNAPHIFSGRHAHALDVDVREGDGIAGLRKWLADQDCPSSLPVPGEPWHLVVTGADLRRLVRKLRRQARAAAKRKRARKAKRADATRMSAHGVAFLVREEGLVPFAYEDSEGHATFGVGHLIHLGPLTQADRDKWGTKEKPKSRLFALRVFRRDLKSYTATVRESVHVPLNWHELAALTSLCFNIGRAGFRESTVVKRLNAGNREGAADAILLWDKPPILKPRRERERSLFLNGHA